MAKKRIRIRGRRRAGFTDDSGVVISGKRYAELHGEPRAEGKRPLGVDLVGKKSAVVFAKISQRKDTRQVECEYCRAVVPLVSIAFHTKQSHQTFDLRFRPEKAPQKPRKQTGRVPKSISQQTHRQPVIDDAEKNDGMAHYRREGNGQFGSFPLHDDYSDEADAE
jgi:hypothetical protein